MSIIDFTRLPRPLDPPQFPWVNINGAFSSFDGPGASSSGGLWLTSQTRVTRRCFMENGTQYTYVSR